jgi:hypothetical protein
VEFASLEWYAMVSNTINQLYLEELGRPADIGGVANWMHHAREGGKDADWIRARIKELDEWHHVHDKPAFVSLPRLVPSGSVFRTEGGGRFTAIEASDFNLFGRFMREGADAIEPVLKERASLGFNMLRVWGAYSGNPTFEGEIGHLIPGEHADYYDKLPQFLNQCAAHKLYVEFTAFTAGPIPGHWEKCGDALRSVTNVIVELTNENDAHASANLPDISELSTAAGHRLFTWLERVSDDSAASGMGLRGLPHQRCFRVVEKGRAQRDGALGGRRGNGRLAQAGDRQREHPPGPRRQSQPSRRRGGGVRAPHRRLVLPFTEREEVRALHSGRPALRRGPRTGRQVRQPGNAGWPIRARRRPGDA